MGIVEQLESSAEGLVNKANQSSIFRSLYDGNTNRTISPRENDRSKLAKATPAPQTRFNQFASAIKKNGLAKQYFECEFQIPNFLLGREETTDILSFYVQATNLPEFNAATQQIKDNGLTREVVVDKTYGAVTMMFFCDQNMTIKNFFDIWGQASVESKGGKFAYPSEYTVDRISIKQYNAAKTESYIVNLNNAYPKIISEAQLSADAKAPLMFSVVWAFESWDAYNREETEADNRATTIVGTPAIFDTHQKQKNTIANLYNMMGKIRAIQSDPTKINAILGAMKGPYL